MAKPKAIVSACLLGEYCRYDGKTKKDNHVVESLKDYEIIPFCPEAPLFGTPRQRINVVRTDGQNRIITDETNIDVTTLLEDEIESFIKDNPQAKKIILKSKSPSCGIGSTLILDEQKNTITKGNGIAADIFLKKYPSTLIVDENSI